MNAIPESLKEFFSFKSRITDYNFFKFGSPSERDALRKAIIQGYDQIPCPTYPKLEQLFTKPDDDDEISFFVKKSTTAATIRTLELFAVANLPADIHAQIILETSGHQKNLQKMELVEGAHHLLETGDPSQFMQANQVLHGMPDWQTFNAALYPEDLFSDKLLHKLQGYVWGHYASVLEIIPDTTDDVLYGAEDCASFFNKALMAIGPYDEGWRAEIDPDRIIISDNEIKKRLFLPATMWRNAKDLRQRVIHEIVIHTLRACHGAASGCAALEHGTANYLDAEEGIAVLLECAVAGSWQNEGIDRARQRYIAAGLINNQQGNARQTYDALYPVMLEYFKLEDSDATKDLAFTHTENAFRGTDFSTPGVFYSKLQLYFGGLVKNIQLLSAVEDIDQTMDEILLGKYDHTNPAEKNLVLALLGKEVK